MIKQTKNISKNARADFRSSCLCNTHSRLILLLLAAVEIYSFQRIQDKGARHSAAGNPKNLRKTSAMHCQWQLIWKCSIQ